MTKAEFGYYGYILAICGSVASIINFSLPTFQTKEIQEKKDQVAFFAKLTFSLLIFQVFLIGIFAIILFSFKELIFIKNDKLFSVTTFILLAFNVLSTSIVSMYKSYLLSINKQIFFQKVSVILLLLIHIISISSFYLFRFSGYNIRFGIYTLIYVIFSVVILIKYLPFFQTISKIEINRIFKINSPLFLGSISGLVINMADRFFLDRYNLSEGLGDITLAITAGSVLSLFNSSYAELFEVEFFKETNYEKSKKLMFEVVKKVTLLNLTISIIIFSFCAVFYVLNIIPINYKNALIILPFILVSKSLISTTNLVTHNYVFFEKTKFNLYHSIITGIFTTFISWYLIKNHQLLGAGYSSLASSLLSLIIAITFTTIIHNEKKNIL
jgi:O-antigen/teichoic acid export membrane protein